MWLASFLIFEPSNFPVKWHGLGSWKPVKSAELWPPSPITSDTNLTFGFSKRKLQPELPCPTILWCVICTKICLWTVRIEQIHRTFSVKEFHWSYHYVVLYFAMKYSKCGKRYHVLFYFEWDFPNKSWCVIKDTVCLI